jgi:hypothetical protein
MSGAECHVSSRRSSRTCQRRSAALLSDASISATSLAGRPGGGRASRHAGVRIPVGSGITFASVLLLVRAEVAGSERTVYEHGQWNGLAPGSGLRGRGVGGRGRPASDQDAGEVGDASRKNLQFEGSNRGSCPLAIRYPWR